MPSTATWWLYVLECRGGVLYTGIAKEVDARFAAHLKGTAPYSPCRADKLQWCATGLQGFITWDRG